MPTYFSYCNRPLCFLVFPDMFIGFAGSEFSQLLAASPAGGSVYAATGATASIASGRLSYVLGLHGPCVSYDTACSAALVASHAGLRALQLDECSVSQLAAVTLMLAPGIGTTFAVAGIHRSPLSPPREETIPKRGDDRSLYQLQMPVGTRIESRFCN